MGRLCDESPIYLFYEQYREKKITWFGEARKIKFLLPKRLNRARTVNICGTMSESGLSAIHIMPQGQTVDAEYYVEDILHKEVKPLLERSKRTNEATTIKMVVNKRRFAFQQDGAPPIPPNKHRIGIFKTCQSLYLNNGPGYILI